MSADDVVSQLKQTEKGSLKYGEEKIAGNASHQRLLHFPSSFNNKSVVDLSSLQAALETCEESAFAEERNYNQQKQRDAMKKKNEAITLELKPEIRNISLVGQDVTSVIEKLTAETNKDKDDCIFHKTRLYGNVSANLFKSAQYKCAAMQEKLHEKMFAEQEKLRKYFMESEETAQRIKEQNSEQHKSRNRILKTRLQEAENRRLLKLQQGKERLQSAEPIVARCSDIHKALMHQIKEISNKPFAENDEVRSNMKSVRNAHVSTLTILEECRSRQVMEQNELDNLTRGYDAMLQLSHKLIAMLEKLKLQAQNEALAQQELLRIEKAKEEENEKLKIAEREKHLSEKNPELSCPQLPKELRLSVSRSAYYNYLQLKKVLAEYEDVSKQFVADKSNQKMIMGISKAISVPISSITNRSGSDIKNRLSDLNGVLSGQNVKVGNQHVSITSNSAATSYACIFMAKKFVKQAEGQVSSSHSAAFSLALTLLGVWAKNEEFGKLVLGQMCTRCPFIVPWYVPKLDGQTEKEYNKSRGYIYSDDDTVEGQDKYLSRMSGLVRSYAAVIQSPLPPGVRNHPHGIAEGWRWITRMLNLEPWPDVTATVLYDFLYVAGHALMKTYGRQFEKLLYSLCHDYFPKIQEVSGNGGGPVKRLQMFLKDCIKAKNVPKPDGYLGEDFWNTYHHTGVVGS